MFPKTLEEQFEDLDNSMQKLYDKMGWGEYNTRKVSASEFLEEMMKLVPSGGFQPYAYYNEDMDSIETYFKDESCYTKTLNNMVELHLSFDNDEVVGVNILGIKKLIQDKGKFK